MLWLKTPCLATHIHFWGVLTKILLQKEENIQNFRTILEFTRKSLKHLTWSHTMKKDILSIVINALKKKKKSPETLFFLASSPLSCQGQRTRNSVIFLQQLLLNEKTVSCSPYEHISLQIKLMVFFWFEVFLQSTNHRIRRSHSLSHIQISPSNYDPSLKIII